MSPVRHVIFDLDGTLVDSLPGIAFSVDAALAACGLPPAGVSLAPLIGPPVREILAAVSGATSRELLDWMERSFRASYDAEGWRRTVCLPGVPDMLRRLMTGGVDLWIATNKPALPTGRILRELNVGGGAGGAACPRARKQDRAKASTACPTSGLLTNSPTSDARSLGSFFREAACRDSRTPPFASKAEVLLDLLARHHLDRAACLMVGDTAEDWHAAETAGIACAIVGPGNGPRALPEGCCRIGGWEELEEMALMEEVSV
jgi:phosphoglycolate phosphatase